MGEGAPMGAGKEGSRPGGVEHGGWGGAQGASGLGRTSSVARFKARPITPYKAAAAGPSGGALPGRQVV